MHIVKGNKNGSPTCSVRMGDKLDKFTDFIAVGYNGNSNAVTVASNADVFTLAAALELVKQKFVESYNKLTEAEQVEFNKVIEGRI